jgi:hypothetical protein
MHYNAVNFDVFTIQHYNYKTERSPKFITSFPRIPLTYMYMCVGMNVMSVMSVVVCRVSLSLV